MAKLTQGSGGEKISTTTYKLMMIALVHASAVGLGEVLKNYRSEAERTDFIRTYVNKIRFYPDQTGYFFVHTINCVNIAHATQKELQGQSLYNYQDSKGKYVLRELTAAAKKGGGFVEYYWAKPGSAGDYKKLAYAESIPGTDYCIGTGAYIKG